MQSKDMAIDLFLKVDGVTGESNDSNHKDWTGIHSFSWQASQKIWLSVGRYSDKPFTGIKAGNLRLPFRNVRPFILLI